MYDKHSDVGQENARSIIIEGWMRMVLATGGIERFDDLHIDKIDPAWRGRESWVNGSSEAIDLAKGLKTSIAPEKTLAIMCALTNADSELVPPRSPNELSEQIDWTPPSLYLFDPGNEPWGDLGTVTVTPTVRMFNGCSECFVMEFRTKKEKELRRTFVAVSYQGS
jgi:hypothetical protein